MTDPTPPAPRQASNILPCPTCGYDLRGLPDLACPECGKQTTLAEIEEARGTPLRLRVRGIVLHAVICAIVGGIATSAAWPSVLSPAPFVLLFPLFKIGPSIGGAIAAGAIGIGGSLLWSRRAAVSRGWTAFWLLAAISNVIWLVVCWDTEHRYHTGPYLYSVLALSSALMLLGSLLWWRNGRAPTFFKHWCFQTIGMTWLCSYAFPYLGEY